LPKLQLLAAVVRCNIATKFVGAQSQNSFRLLLFRADVTGSLCPAYARDAVYAGIAALLLLTSWSERRVLLPPPAKAGKAERP
jgi:hypothetical protein